MRRRRRLKTLVAKEVKSGVGMSRLVEAELTAAG